MALRPAPRLDMDFHPKALSDTRQDNLLRGSRRLDTRRRDFLLRDNYHRRLPLLGLAAVGRRSDLD